jgi:hypothetical protein
MKRLVSLVASLLFLASSWAQLSKDDAVVLVATARIAAAFPVKAEICGWTNANTTWDTLRYLAASYSVHTSEFRSKLTSEQAIYAAQKAVADEDSIRSIAKLFLEHKPCDDESAPTNKAAWEKYVVKLNEFADQEVERLKNESDPRKRKSE